MNKKRSNIFVSFVEECVLNPEYQDCIAGRIEVSFPKDKLFPSEEIRFLTKKIDEFRTFRDEWDMTKISFRDLIKIRNMVTEMFNDGIK